VDQADVSAAEGRLGFLLPALLREIYSEVGNGGFGPFYGLLGLPRGATTEYGLDCVALYERLSLPDAQDAHWAWPAKHLPIGHLGWGMFACVDCESDLAPIVWYDPNSHEAGSPWEDSFIPLISSLEAWLTGWLEGTDGDLFDHAWEAKFCRPKVFRDGAGSVIYWNLPRE
jgi:hypothetical protein